MLNKSHLTAISRNKPSVPMRHLHEKGYLIGTMLDFGCGKGTDADHFKMDKFDPYWYKAPIVLNHYDTITCNYVLNVIQDDNEVYAVLNTIQMALKETGLALITVRRDVKTEGFTSKGTFQRNIKLKLLSLKKTSSYETYLLTKNQNLDNIILGGE